MAGRALLLVAQLLLPVWCGLDGIEYLFVSQTRNSQIVYFKVNALTKAVDSDAIPLVTEGLQEPMGVALDEQRHRLYVADAGLKKVLRFNLVRTKQGMAVNGAPREVLTGSSPRWVAVDEVEGGIYCTDTSGTVEKIFDAEQDEDTDADDDDDNDTPRQPEKRRVLYTNSASKFVHSPAGIAAEGQHLFWADRQGRKAAIVTGMEEPEQRNPEDPRGTVTNFLAHADEVVYGVCTTRDDVYWTTKKRFVYGSKKGSRETQTWVAADNFDQPRGCAWDGDGTIYVVDEHAGAIFAVSSWTGGQHRPAERLANVEAPWGIAVLKSRSRRVGFLQGVPGHSAAGGLIWGAGNPTQEDPTWDNGRFTTATDGQRFSGGAARARMCLWLFVPVFGSIFCLGAAAFKGEEKKAYYGSFFACLVPFFTLLYMYNCTDIVYDFLSGGHIERTCAFLVAWSLVQIFFSFMACGWVSSRPLPYKG